MGLANRVAWGVQAKSYLYQQLTKAALFTVVSTKDSCDGLKTKKTLYIVRVVLVCWLVEVLKTLERLCRTMLDRWLATCG